MSTLSSGPYKVVLAVLGSLAEWAIFGGFIYILYFGSCANRKGGGSNQPQVSSGQSSQPQSYSTSMAPQLTQQYAQPSGVAPFISENGDVRGADNDGDGRLEPIHVRGYTRQDGTYVQGHYRALPHR